MIIQGSNAPIILTFSEDASKFKAIEVSLYTKTAELKHWSKANMTIQGNEVSCPLTEAETLGFPRGLCMYEVKWQDSNGVNQFNKIVSTEIGFRRDKTAMTTNGN